VRRFFLHAALACAVAALACNHSRGTAGGAEATEEWTRDYQLDPDGEVEILTHNGSVDVNAAEPADAGEARAVRIRAIKTAHAPTEAGARELLPRLPIRETIDGSKITVQTGRLGGPDEGPSFIIGVSTTVAYTATVPAGAVLHVRTGNAPIRVSGVSGRVLLTNSNAPIVGKALGGGVTARVTNNNLTIELASVGSDPVELRAINGQVRLVLPATANANLTASATNGAIEVKGLTLAPFGEQNARRVRGRLNAGGTPIELAVTNGKILIEGTAQ
jgi:hypothetical protein